MPLSHCPTYSGTRASSFNDDSDWNTPLICSSTYRFESTLNAKILSLVLRCNLSARLLPMMAEFVSVMFRVCPSTVVNGFSLMSSWGIMPLMNTDWSFIVLGAIVSGLMANTPSIGVILLAMSI